MKHSIVTLVFLISSVSIVFGQDQIILKSAEELKGKVTEVKIDLIVYKDQTNPDGPSIELKKEDVFMIIYENGSVFKVSQTDEYSESQSTAQPKTSQKKVPKPKTDRLGRSKEENLALFNKRLKLGIPLTVIGIPCIAVGASMIDDVISRRPGRPTINGPFSNLTDAEALGVGIPLAAIGVAFTIIGPINIGAAIGYKVKANSLASNTTVAPFIPVAEHFNEALANRSLGLGLKFQLSF